MERYAKPSWSGRRAGSAPSTACARAALHVGKVLRIGSGWASGKIEIPHVAIDRPRASEGPGPEELERVVEKCGGVRAASDVAGIPRSSISDDRTGKRLLPAGVVKRISGVLAAGDADASERTGWTEPPESQPRHPGP